MSSSQNCAYLHNFNWIDIFTFAVGYIDDSSSRHNLASFADSHRRRKIGKMQMLLIGAHLKAGVYTLAFCCVIMSILLIKINIYGKNTF